MSRREAARPPFEKTPQHSLTGLKAVAYKVNKEK
jgi:hypothetical protein